MDKLSGIHAVREALAAGRPLQAVIIARGRHGDRLEEIVKLARSKGVQVRFEDRAQVDRAAGTRDHQGVVAMVAARAAVTLEDLLARRKAGAEGSGAPGPLVLLDGVEDPQNLGAIIRTALAAGAAGIVIPDRRSSGLTDATARVSAGAIEYLPVARVTNLARAMEQLKKAGYWLVGLDERAPLRHSEVDLTGAIALVLGGEGKGLHELVRERCDFLASIPTSGPIPSLNVSVAAGIALFEVVRQRAQARDAAGKSTSAGRRASSHDVSSEKGAPEADAAP
jgi:23S rRNA (guanosine2251-2'-O)-methyltransferase